MTDGKDAATQDAIGVAGSAPRSMHPKFRMWLRPDGIVQLVWGPGVAMGLEDAIAAIDAMTKLTGGQRAPLLVDTGPLLDRLRGGVMMTSIAILAGDGFPRGPSRASR